MGIFDRFSVSLGLNKKNSVAFLPSSSECIYVSKNTTKCLSYPVKTLASFDLNIESPKYEGAIPEATIMFYPLD